MRPESVRRSGEIRLFGDFEFEEALMGAHDIKDSWEHILEARMAGFGHRNWIVVADSAYPKQVAAGIETIPTGADHLSVLDTVMNLISGVEHVRPIVHLDTELQFLGENDAPGIEVFRDELAQQLNGLDVRSRLHEEIIYELDEAGKSFHVLLLKTNLTLPYTSVFLQLDCGYWGEEAEQTMRRSMESAQQG